jgi:NADP-dependent 3-hydroxy acid dehydrogenase YdfG
MNLAELGFTSIAGKVIVITGASNGIGQATAKLLGKHGAKLALAARRLDKLETTADDIVAAGGQTPLCLQLDVQDEDACAAAIQKTVAHFGKIDVLINNAGVGIPTPDLSELETERYLAQMRTNVDGVVFLTREALKTMKQAKTGHIINISSMAGVTANPVAPLYCTSKFALEGYNEGLRKQLDLWKKNEGIEIRVSNVKPGAVDSGYWGDRDVPRGKFMTCDEMAAALFWTVALKPEINITELRLESRR